MSSLTSYYLRTLCRILLPINGLVEFIGRSMQQCRQIVSMMSAAETMERSQWMYNTSRPAPSYVKGVIKFVDNARKHALSVNRKVIICPCSHCKNELAQIDSGEVHYHLIRWGFVQGYTVQKFHGEQDATAASGGTSVQIQGAIKEDEG